VSLLLICSIVLSEDVQILTAPLEQLLKDVSLLSLGCNQNLELARDVGYAVAMLVRLRGYEYCVIGTMSTLKQDDESPLGKISRSPYITAQVLVYLAEGLVSGGVVPLLNATGEVDPNVVKSLISREAVYPAYVEDESKALLLERMGYTATFATPQGVIRGRLPQLVDPPPIETIDIDSLRRQLLEGAVVLLNKNKRSVSVNDPFSEDGVLVFSNEEWLIEKAYRVLDGKEVPTGRSP